MLSEAKAPTRPDRLRELADCSWLAGVLAVLITTLTASTRAVNPNAEHLVGAVSTAFCLLGWLLAVGTLVGVVRHRRRRLLFAGLVGLALNSSLGIYDLASNRDRVVYLGPDWLPHVYRVREPTGGPSAVKGVLIYMHGAGGTERQGLEESFAPLARAVANRSWAYVCPRDDEFEGLRAELQARYGDAPYYLAGASMGGRHVFEEASRHPSRYRGVVLLCPAMGYQVRVTQADAFPPTWLVCGDADSIALEPSRALAEDLRKLGIRSRYQEIPGGDHGAPVGATDWEAALSFLTR